MGDKEVKWPDHDREGTRQEPRLGLTFLSRDSRQQDQKPFSPMGN